MGQGSQAMNTDTCPTCPGHVSDVGQLSVCRTHTPPLKGGVSACPSEILLSGVVRDTLRRMA